MNIKKEQHFINLNASYKKVVNLTLKNQDLLNDNLKVSRDLFTDASLTLRQPMTKALEVYPLVSGLPFEKQFTKKLVLVQKDISKILGDSLHYFVKPENFGVEYCVFKWPWEEWNKSWMSEIQDELSNIKFNSFNFTINGIQINPDGCVIAKGFDEGVELFSIRQHMKDTFHFLPKKQSAWAHIPIGRILEPLGKSKFANLMQYINGKSEQFIASQQISSLKLIHETQWYMEKHEIISEYAAN
jgi:hypothetical protein